ncbi:Metaxin-3 [Pitangus sulphuratus]|nr:Metaxin-3 [Pitangus sulphuratus]
MGPDGIHPRMMRELVEELNKPLSIIYRQSWLAGEVLDDWKLVNVTPIHKKGQKEDVGNYRPVGLTSVPGKVMEQIILSAITQHTQRYTSPHIRRQGDFSASKNTKLLKKAEVLHGKFYEMSAIFIEISVVFILMLIKLHTFWIEAENYCSVTKPWFASRIAFPLSLYLPGKMSSEALNRILLTKGGPPLYSLTEVEAQIYRDAKECLNLLSKRLGTSQFFFGDTPTTLDAFVFGFLAPIYKVCFPRVQLQEHLKQLPNLCRFCDEILTCYFRLSVSGHSPAGQDTADANLQKLTQLVNKESNLIEKMDNNLRKSPQHPPRKLTTLKLAAGGEESSPFSRLSP